MDVTRRPTQGLLAGHGLALVVNQLGHGGHADTVLVGTDDPGRPLTLTLLRAGASDPEELTIAAPSLTGGWSVGWFARAQLPADLTPGEHQLTLSAPGQAPVHRALSVIPGRLPAVVISDVLGYFRSSRSFGEIDRKDRTAHYYDAPELPPIDARGGWLDASGDFSKFLSHLTYTDLMSPQQIPLCAWAFAAANEQLARRHPELVAGLGSRLRDEALFGADFLVRFQHPQGWFHVGIFDALTKNLAERVLTAPLADSVRTQHWRAGFRHGGGLAIAALARCSVLDQDGEFSREEYYRRAVLGHDHLVEHNEAYLPGGRETVLDDYCAALAAAELVLAARARADHPVVERATEQLTSRLQQLIDRLRTDPAGRAYLNGVQDHGAGEGRPFCHAVETGLPITALVRGAQVLADHQPELAQRCRRAAIQLAEGAHARATAVPNPFHHPRHVVAVHPDGATTEQFFYPHQNQTGYWWQGENANLASLAWASLQVAELVADQGDDPAALRGWAHDLIGWVLGLNPYGACMLQGRGVGAVEYSPIFQNLPGGVLNGITSGFDDEDDIAYAPAGPMATGEAWRWAEQWIPHSAWLLLAASATTPAIPTSSQR